MLEEFPGCTPSQLKQEDAQELLGIMELRSYARAKELIEREDTDEDALQKARLSPKLIDQVMANIARAMER
jgi:hypothetical protein